MHQPKYFLSGIVPRYAIPILASLYLIFACERRNMLAHVCGWVVLPVALFAHAFCYVPYRCQVVTRKIDFFFLFDAVNEVIFLLLPFALRFGASKCRGLI